MLAAHGATIADLTTGPARPALRGAVAEMVGRARPLLAAARPLTASLHGRPRLAVAGFAAGGWAALDALEGHGYDVTSQTLRPARHRLLLRWLGGLRARPIEGPS